MKKLRTHEEARAWLSYQGISVAQWARENNFPYSLTQEILAGRKKCLRGMSHNIAVKLGMKAGVLTTHPGRGTPVRSKAKAAAAQAQPEPNQSPTNH
jgi:gp16 family phage-associated protein